MAGHRAQSKTPIALKGIQVQSSIAGLPVPLGWGTFRVPCNLLWYGAFTAVPQTQKTGGKGGGSSQTTGYTYNASIVAGICAGPIAGIRAVYKDQSSTTLAGAGLTLFTGAIGQAPWAYLSSNFSGQAIGYSGLAYVAASAYALSTSATLPNHSFEVQTTTRVSGLDDANPKDIVTQFLAAVPFWQSVWLGDLTNYSNYCLAAGLVLSPVLTSQRTGFDFITEIMHSSNSEVVWSEGLLRIVPYGDTTTTGNGVTYTPNLTPIYTLDNTVLMPSAPGEDPVLLSIGRDSDAWNHIQVEYLDRLRQYNTHIMPGTDPASIDQYGKRANSSPYALHAICDAGVATRVAQLLVQRTSNVRRHFRFNLPWNYCLLDPMDLVQLVSGDLNLLVRIEEISEGSDGLLQFLAEEMLVGSGAAPLITRQAPSGYLSNYESPPGNASAPVILIPPRQLTAGEYQVWIGASGGANWGGCEVFLSFDNSTYQAVGVIDGPARYGVTTSVLATGSDPDTTNTVGIDLTASGATLNGSTSANADNHATLALIGNEIVSYSTATLTGSHTYTLGTYTRRGIAGTTIGSQAAGSTFVRLDDSIFAFGFRRDQVGKTVYIKFRSFNTFGQAHQDISTISAYSIVLAASGASFTLVNWTSVGAVPANLAALTGSETIKNNLITVASGALLGIGSGAGTVVDNTQIVVNATTGVMSGIGTAGVTVDNTKIAITPAGALTGAGGGSVTIGGLGYGGDLNAGTALRLSNILSAGGANLTIAGNSATWVSGANWAQAVISSESFVESGYVGGTFTTASVFMLGITSQTTPTGSYTTTDCGLYASAPGNPYLIYELGSPITANGATVNCTAGDFGVISSDGVTIRYYIVHGVITTLIHTSSVNPVGKAFRLHCSFTSGTISDLKISTSSSNQWTKLGGVPTARLYSNNLMDTGPIQAGGTFYGGVNAGNFTGPAGTTTLPIINGPSGVSLTVLHAVAVDAGQIGGWNYTFRAVDGYNALKTYRMSGYVRRISGGGACFLGCSLTTTNSIAGVANTNPYFVNTTSMTNGQWYVAVGILHGSQYAGADTGLSGLYDPQTGKVVSAGGDFKSIAGSTSQVHRTFGFYGVAGDIWEFAQPAIVEVERAGLGVVDLFGAGALNNSNQQWLDVSGATKPANNAGTTLHLNAAFDTGGTLPAVTGNSASGGAGSWLSSVISSERYVGACVAEATVLLRSDMMVGLTSVASPTSSYTQIDYALFCTNSATYYIYESGGSPFNSTVTPVVGDHLAVVSNDVVVKYLVNGVVIYTSLVSPQNKKFRLMCSFAGGVNGAFADIAFNALSSNQWGILGGAGKAEDYATSSDNLVTNGAFSANLNNWTPTNGVTWAAFGVGSPSSGGATFTPGSTQTINANNNGQIAIAGAQKIYASAQAYKGSGITGGSLLMVLYWYKADGTTFSAIRGQDNLSVLPGTAALWTPAAFSGIIPPSDAAYMLVQFYSTITGTGVAYVSNVRVSRTENGADITINQPVVSKLSVATGNASTSLTDTNGRRLTKISDTGTARNTDVVSFSATMPSVPTMVFLPGGNAAASGQNVSIVASSLSVSGFTMVAKSQGVTASGTVSDATTHTRVAGDPAIIIIRSNSGAPFDGNFTFNYAVVVGSIGPGEPGNIQVDFYVRKSGSWANIGTRFHGASGSYSMTVAPGSVDYAAGVAEFGGSMTSGSGVSPTTALSGFGPVVYTLGSVVDTSLTPTGASPIPWMALLS